MLLKEMNGMNLLGMEIGWRARTSLLLLVASAMEVIWLVEQPLQSILLLFP